MAKTFVYVISGDHGRQKIGSSDNPPQRIRDLQTGSPYKLKFEFIGETEDSTGGAIEVEAQFMLAQHKAPGGDEWFVVPSDVAITAVMAAAHRLGYRCKPVDVDSAAAKRFQIGMPPWAGWVGFSISMMVFFAVLMATDHFLTALIAGMLSLIAVKPMMRGVVAITGDALD